MKIRLDVDIGEPKSFYNRMQKRHTLLRENPRKSWTKKEYIEHIKFHLLNLIQDSLDGEEDVPAISSKKFYDIFMGRRKI